jgi:hypothetical protein
VVWRQRAIVDGASMAYKRVVFLGALFLLGSCAVQPQPPQMLGRIRAPIDFRAVGLFTPECKPASYQTVAKLDASKLGNFSSYQFNLNWIRALRKQAGTLGANGLLLVPINHGATWGAIHHGPAFKAWAVWEPPPASTAGIAEMPEPACITETELSYKVTHGWGPGVNGNGG